MVPCRCELLNVMSGDVASEYARGHLERARTDGMGREVLRCPDTGVEWTQEESASGYAAEAIVLRRGSR